MSDPFVGKLTYFRVYSGVLKAGSHVYNPADGPQGARRPHPPDARQQPRGARVGRRRRDRRRRRPQAGHDRRHALRRGAPGRCSSRSRSRSPSSGWPSSPRRRPTRTSSPTRSARLSEEDPTFRVRTDDETGQTSSPAWASCTSRSSSTASCASSASRPTSASRRSPTARPSAAGRQGAGQVRAPDRRPRPVRRRGHLARAEPRQGLRVRQQDHRRRDPAGVHQVGRRGHPGGDGVGHARRLPRRRRQGRR